MSAPLLTVAASVVCEHGGKAAPTTVSARVRVDGHPACLLAATYVVAGCTLPPPPAANGPCLSARWLVGTTRVRSEGIPLLIQSGEARCAPTGTGLRVLAVQQRVRAR
jgi:hypothetical protein